MEWTSNGKVKANYERPRETDHQVDLEANLKKANVKIDFYSYGVPENINRDLVIFTSKSFLWKFTGYMIQGSYVNTDSNSIN